MESFKIEGHHPLSGTVRPAGNKNEALPALAACLLSDQSITYTRMPRIGDVLTLCDILISLDVELEWHGEDSLTVCAKRLTSHRPSIELCKKIRASILLLGPLLARLNRIELPLPGGDVIGARRIDTHWEGLIELGAQLDFGPPITGKTNRLCGCELYLDEPSVTATENLLLAASGAEGTTHIFNAACEPHITGLCRLLIQMGVQISGVASNHLIINPPSSWKCATHKIGPDFMEIGSFLCLGAIAGGTITIEDIHLPDLRYILKTLFRLGISPEKKKNSLTIEPAPLAIQKDITGRVGTIYSGPWPAFPTDLMSVAIVTATLSEGTMIFFEKMFEGRMFFTDKLMAMGANIVLCDPHRIVVNGSKMLYAAHLSSPDVRAGMALLTSALVAKGTSTIDNIAQIERGYLDIEKKLLSLGAAIKKIS